MKSPVRALVAALLCTTCLLPLAACGGNAPSDDAAGTTDTPPTETVTETVTLSPEERLTADREAYLSTVAYRDFVLTGESEPYFMGRWFDKDLDGVSHKITFSDGAHLYFLIENAASFDVHFTVITTGAEPYFAYSIDGAAPVRQHITEPTVNLPDTGSHTVRIVADGMEEREGKWDQEKGFALKAITPAEGGSIVGIKPTERVIFFYGDSITEGVCALDKGSSSDTNSATNAYAWLCAEKLGVTPYVIGYGASGMIMEGSFNTMLNAIDYHSQGRPVADGIIPDIIVINHGTNDKSANGADFKAAMTATLNRLREKYPDAPIVYVIPFNQTHRSSITRCLEDMGLENTHVVQTVKWKLTFTDGIHPDVAGAEKAASKLAEELEKIFGENFF